LVGTLLAQSLLTAGTGYAADYAPIVALWKIGKDPIFLNEQERSRFFTIVKTMKKVTVTGKPRQTDKEFCYWTVMQTEHSLAQKSFLVYDDGTAFGWRANKDTQLNLAMLVRELLARSDPP